MLSVVTIASAVALAEPVIAWLVQRLRLPRPLAAALLGAGVWLLSWGCALSFNRWHGLHWLGSFNLFQLLELATTALLLPLVSLLTALLVGYRLRPEILRVELYRESRYLVYLVRACLRYIAPPVIILIMLTAFIESF
jgi:NSS family neurotransmitter:Na+ symporter